MKMTNKGQNNNNDYNFLEQKLVLEEWYKDNFHLTLSNFPSEILEMVHSGRHYPLKFAKKSPLYIARILKIYGRQKKYVKMRMLIQYNDFTEKYRVNKSIHKYHLLTSTKKCIIPLTVFCALSVATLTDSWESPLIIPENFEIKPILVEFTSFFEFNHTMSFKKLQELNVNHNRFPINIIPKTPDTKLLNLFPLDYDVGLEKLIDNNIKYIGFTYGNFSLTESFNWLKPPPKIEEEKEKEKRSPSSRRRPKRIKKDNDPNYKINGNKGIGKPTTPQRTTKGRQTRMELTPRKRVSILEKMSKNGSNQGSTIEVSPQDSTIQQGTSNSDNSQISSENLISNEPQTNLSQNTEKIPSLKRSSRNSRKSDYAKNEAQSNNCNLEQNPEITNEDKSPSVQKQTCESKIFKIKAKKLVKIYNREEKFINDFKAFYQKKYHHLPRIPKMGWIEVDVYKLFVATIQRGGFRKVTEKMLWKDIYRTLNSSTIVSNAATTMKSHYKKLLLDFEDYLFSYIDLDSIQTHDDDQTVPGQEDTGLKNGEETIPNGENYISPNGSQHFMMENILKRNQTQNIERRTNIRDRDRVPYTPPHRPPYFEGFNYPPRGGLDPCYEERARADYYGYLFYPYPHGNHHICHRETEVPKSTYMMDPCRDRIVPPFHSIEPYYHHHHPGHHLPHYPHPHFPPVENGVHSLSSEMESMDERRRMPPGPRIGYHTSPMRPFEHPMDVRIMPNGIREMMNGHRRMPQSNGYHPERMERLNDHIPPPHAHSPNDIHYMRMRVNPPPGYYPYRYGHDHYIYPPSRR